MLPHARQLTYIAATALMISCALGPACLGDGVEPGEIVIGGGDVHGTDGFDYLIAVDGSAAAGWRCRGGGTGQNDVWI